MTLTNEQIEELKELARRETWEDSAQENGEEYVNPYEYSGGNSDDCYLGGQEVGESYVARRVLSWMGISWVEGN